MRQLLNKAAVGCGNGISPAIVSGLLTRVLTVLRAPLRTFAEFAVVSRRHRRSQWRRIMKALERLPPTVQGGPFAGMRLGTITTGSHAPKRLGTYELELHPFLEKLCRRTYRTVVDVGCGEGFYAIGLALRLPAAHVYAFDLDRDSLKACQENAALNGVTARVHLQSECDHERLQSLCAPGGTFVFMDCESCEADLLDIDKIPALSSSDILVETHDFLRAGITALLTQRFETTHAVTVIGISERSTLGVLPHLNECDRRRALDESRPASQVWLGCLRREHSAPAGLDVLSNGRKPSNRDNA